MSTTTSTEARTVASTIKAQIGIPSLMRVGASDFMCTSEQRGGLVFKAWIAPKGQSRARVMQVQVILTGADLYDVTVGYLQARTYAWVEHYSIEGVYADQLAEVIRRLDA